jgi:hypothetical protein
MRNGSAGFFLLAILIVMGPFIPAISAAVPDREQLAGPVVMGQDFNITGVALENTSIPARYQVNPTTIRVEIAISETSIPGPKGEMQAGPRTIGLSITPATMGILTLVLIVIGAVAWYMLKRKRIEEEEG